MLNIIKPIYLHKTLHFSHFLSVSGLESGFACALPKLRALSPLSLSEFLDDLPYRPTYFRHIGAILEQNMDRCLQICNDEVSEINICMLGRMYKN